MAYPSQSIRERYLTLEEINSKDTVPQIPQSSPYMVPAWITATGINTKNTSEIQPSVACSSSKATMRPLRRLSKVRNFEKIPECPAFVQSDDVEDALQIFQCFDRRNSDPSPEFNSKNHHSFNSAWWEKSHNPVVDLDTIRSVASAPMNEPLNELSDFRDPDFENEGEEAYSYSPSIIKTEGSSEHLKRSHHEGQNFITPKISFDNTPSEITEDPQPGTEESLLQRPESIVLISDSDLDSLQSVSEPESDSESWVNEPTIAELEGKVHIRNERLIEISQKLEASPKRDRVQRSLNEMLPYQERQEFFTAARVSSVVQAQPSSLLKPINQKGPLNKTIEYVGDPRPYTLTEVPCYCQGDLKDDDIRVPLPILKIQIRNLRQQITEISEERKHYKETREKLQGQFYTLLRRKPEFLAEYESATFSVLRQKIAALEKIKSDQGKSLYNLKSYCTEEKKVHDTISASHVAKHDKLLKEHTQLKEEFQSLARAFMDAEGARLNQEGMQQKIDNLKDLIKQMNETQTARYRVLETQVCSICSQKTTTLNPDSEASAIALDSTKLTAGLPTASDKRIDYEVLLQAYHELEQEHRKTKRIQSELEKAVSEQQLAAENAYLENDQLSDHITEFTQKHKNNTLQARPLPSSSTSPSTPITTDTTSETIGKLNHKLTSENARLTRAAESDATIRNCQSEKINQLTQRCALAHTANEQLTRELVALRTAHLKLEKAHAIAQEAYKALERSATRTVASVPTGSASGRVVGAVTEDAAVSKRLGFMHCRGKDVGDASQSRAVLRCSRAEASTQTVPTFYRSGIAERVAAGADMVAWVPEAKKREKKERAVVWGEGQREDDYATPGNSDVEY